jgi:preprotein translocase subunit SecF
MVNLQEGQGMKDLRNSLEKNGFPEALVQTIGEDADNEFLIKVGANEANLNEKSTKIKQLLASEFPGSRVDKEDLVGPKAGAQLRVSGFQAMLWALIAIMIYIGLRFDFKYSPGAIAALFHDVTIILGVFGLLNLEFTLQIVAALLAVIGYSVNDTVVIYDRVREHEEKYSGLSLSEHINNAVSETLSRTFLTSGTTLFISLSMFFFGGESIKDFFFAISLGVIIGTYSSIFVAAPVTLFFDNLKKKQLQKANA